MASTCSGGRPKWSLDWTCALGSNNWRRFIRCVLRAPPPHTISVFSSGACRSTSSAQAWAVSSVSVACTSRGAAETNWASWGASHWALNRSRPVLLGGWRRKYASARSWLSNGAMTFPPAAQAPSLSNSCPRCCWHQPSMSVLPGPQSKPDIAPSVRSKVMFEIPPMFNTPTACPSCANQAWWKKGASGAPWPPAATSRLRKSAITSIPVSSASRAGWFSCSV